MAKEPRTFEFTIEYKGETHSAWYSMDKGVITVYAKGGKKSAKVSGVPATNVARRLLIEIIKARVTTVS
jgi:hypothetical protein